MGIQRCRNQEAWMFKMAIDEEMILKKSVSEWTLLSEKSLAKTWLSKEEDEAWKDL